MGDSPFVRRNSQREKKNEERARIIGMNLHKTECYDLVLSYDGHDLMDAFQNDNELIVRKWTYDGLDLPTGSLEINNEEKWGIDSVEIALNNVGQSHVWDTIEPDQPFGPTEIEMACEAAKWMMAKGLNSGAGIAYKLVTRTNYQPIRRPNISDLLDML